MKRAGAQPAAGSAGQNPGQNQNRGSGRPGSRNGNGRWNSRNRKGEREYTLSRSDNPDVIYGREVTAEAMSIADIVDEIGEVTIRGRILSNDRRDIRNDKTIVKFSLTDFHDSIYCKLCPHSQSR